MFGIAGCTPKPVTPEIVAGEGSELRAVEAMPDFLPQVDLANIPQLVSQAVPVSDELLMSMDVQMAQNGKLKQRFFAPWRLSRTSISARDAFDFTYARGGKRSYSENLQPYPPERWTKLVALQNMASYPSMAAPAIVVRNTALRNMPTNRPLFLDPSKPGEGFPFDYLQISELWMGTPVFVAHVSADRGWYLVETAFVYGWVRAEDLAFAGPAFQREYEAAQMAGLRQDDVALIAGNGRLLGQTHIGALFPVQGQTGSGLTIKVPVRNAEGQAEVGYTDVTMQQAGITPFPLTSRNIASLADAMAGQQYGWGGLFENRDCSSTVRDLFMNFGIWLPRNSGQQIKQGGFVSLEGLDADTKTSVIRERTVPFLSLIGMRGHIGLYLGTSVVGEPLMLHNVWGVRTMLPGGGEGRAILGRLVITTLRPGESRPDVKPGLFLDRIIGFTNLGR